jgi:hypothetical protein
MGSRTATSQPRAVARWHSQGATERSPTGQGRGPDGRGPDGRGPDGRGPDRPGPLGLGPRRQGPDPAGPDGRVQWHRRERGSDRRDQWHRRERGSDRRDQTGGPRRGPGAVPVAAVRSGGARIGARPPRARRDAGQVGVGVPGPRPSASRRIVDAVPGSRLRVHVGDRLESGEEDRSWAELRPPGAGRGYIGNAAHREPRATANAGRHEERTGVGRGQRRRVG